MKVFDMTQRAAETWLGSCGTARRELLDVLFTNRLADDVSLSMTWRCPFDAVVESALLGDGVANGTRTRDFLDHNQALYRLSYSHREEGREKSVAEQTRATTHFLRCSVSTGRLASCCCT